MEKIIVSISLAVLLCACGNSQGSGAPVWVATSESVSVNPVSKDGNVLVGATLLGGLIGTGVVPLNKSNSIEAGNESVQVALAKIIFQDVLKRSVNGLDQVRLGKSIDALKSGHGQIEYEKESFSVYGGYVTITGAVNYDASESARQISIDGVVTAKFINVSFPVVYDGESKLETINGTIRTDMNADILYDLDDQGNLAKTYADLNFFYTSDWLQITGDVLGNASHINISYRTVADLVSGKAIVGPDCSGVVTVITDKLRESCVLQQACDGCSESSTVEDLK